ncbi:hypothetical protein AB0C76_39415 [Kitasatospora sp. NPDC048722]|uniref:hypothetical protein n=1 Tax=Kitasatospora sp. NPDC048722 TaxID=3155639 RepID=UPI0033CECF77
MRTVRAALMAGAVLAATVAIAAPAQASSRCSPMNGYGEQICVDGVSYNRAEDVSTVFFTLRGPWTDYRVYMNGTSGLYYPGSHAFGINGHLNTSVCVSESTYGWECV